MIFVFGSNLAGVHGAGAAKHAYLHEGAEVRKGIGLAGNSYALPTKDFQIRTMPVSRIEGYIDQFIEFAKMNTELSFKVTRIGCGLAGHKDSEIAPLFKDAPVNCWFDEAWEPYLGAQHNYWGTM